jgi:hypothetical protein
MPRIDGAPILPVVCAQVGAGVDERSPAGLGWLDGGPGWCEWPLE